MIFKKHMKLNVVRVTILLDTIEFYLCDVLRRKTILTNLISCKKYLIYNFSDLPNLKC